MEKSEQQKKSDREKQTPPWVAENNETGEGRFIECADCYEKSQVDPDYDADFYQAGVVREGEDRIYCQSCKHDLPPSSPAVAVTFLPGHPTPPAPVPWAHHYLDPDPQGRLHRRHRAPRRPASANPCPTFWDKLLSPLSKFAHTRPS